MPCFFEKVTAGAAGTGIVGGGVALGFSTATGPAFLGAALAYLAAVGAFLTALLKLADCLASNGRWNDAVKLREKALAIGREIEEFRAWGRSLGVSL